MYEQSLDSFFGASPVKDQFVDVRSTNDKYLSEFDPNKDSFSTELLNSNKELSFNEQNSNLKEADHDLPNKDVHGQSDVAKPAVTSKEETSPLITAISELLGQEEHGQVDVAKPTHISKVETNPLIAAILKLSGQNESNDKSNLLTKSSGIQELSNQIMGLNETGNGPTLSSIDGISALADELNLNIGEISSLVESMLSDNEEISTLAESMKLFSEEISSLVESMMAGVNLSENGDEVSSMVNGMMLGNEEISALAKSMKLYGEGIVSLAKTMMSGDKSISNGDGASSLTKSVKPDTEGLSSLIKSMKLYSEEMSSLAKAMMSGAKSSGNGNEEISTLAKSMKLYSEEMSSLAKAMMSGDKSRGNGNEEITTLAKSMKLYSEEMSSLAKAMMKSVKSDGEGVSTLAKNTTANGNEDSSLAKTMNDNSSVTSKANSANTENKEVLHALKMLKALEMLETSKTTDTSSVADNDAKQGEAGPLSNNRFSNKQGFSNDKTTDENHTNIAKTIPGFVESQDKTAQGPTAQSSKSLNTQTSDMDSKGTFDSNSQGQSDSQNADKTASAESDKNTSKSDSDEVSHTSSSSKSDESTKIYNKNTINGMLEELVQARKTDSSFLNNQAADSMRESNINFVNIKQGAFEKTNVVKASRHINMNQHPETLSTDVANNVIQKAKLHMQGNKSSIKIQLNPPELGHIKLEFREEDNTLNAKITVERAVVKDMIEKDIPKIRELIASADVEVGKFDVSLDEKDEDGNGLTDKESLTDTEAHLAQDHNDQENEEIEEEIEEDLITNILDLNSINYLV